MRTAILFPPSVLITVDYLQARADADTTHAYADGLAVRTREPSPFVTPLVRVRRVGGPSSGVIDRPRIDLTVWHDNEADAEDLANLLSAWMRDVSGVHDGVTVYGAETFSGPSLIWDADRDLPRYLLTFEVSVRGTAL